MNILFLSLGKYSSVNESEGYTDLLREFIRHGHKVYILSPVERRDGSESRLIRENDSVILWVRTGNIQKTNFIEKGISTVMIESQCLNAIKRYFSDVKFDLVLYPTPPITFVKVVEYVKKRDEAKTYLLLKDIFPQNAVDIGIMTKHGVKGLLYKYFRNKEPYMFSYAGSSHVELFGAELDFPFMRTFKCAHMVDFEKVKRKAEVLDDGDDIKITFRAGEDKGTIDTLKIPETIENTL